MKKIKRLLVLAAIWALATAGVSISVSIYPNPTHGSIRVEACDISNISIFNVLGEKVFEREVSGHAFDYDFSGMETGIYLIKVVGKNYIQTQRVTLY